MLFIDNDKTEKAINKLKHKGEKQYLFFDIEEATKYYEMLEHVIQYKNYSGKYKYYILRKSNAIRLDYLLDAFLIKSELIQHIKLDLNQLEKQVQCEYDLTTILKLTDKNNSFIYPSLNYKSIYILGLNKEQKDFRIIFTQFVKEKQQFKLILEQIRWPQLEDKVKKKKLNCKNKKDQIQIKSYFFLNLEFYYRQANQLKQKLHKSKKGIYEQLFIFFHQVDPKLFDYYLIKHMTYLINDVSILIKEIKFIINNQVYISNDIRLLALNDVNYSILERVNNYVIQFINYSNLNTSFQIGLRNMLFESLQIKINQQMLDLIEDNKQVAFLKSEHDNFKNLILQYLTDFIQQL